MNTKEVSSTKFSLDLTKKKKRGGGGGVVVVVGCGIYTKNSQVLHLYSSLPNSRPCTNTHWSGYYEYCKIVFVLVNLFIFGCLHQLLAMNVHTWNSSNLLMNDILGYSDYRHAC